MEIAFLMDRLDTIEPTFETTAHLMYECNQRRHTVYFLEPHDVYIRGNEVVARMWNISVAPDLPLDEYWRQLCDCIKRDELIFETITELDALFLRKNPPLNYQTMEFLCSVEDRVFMINSTTGQVLGNSKLYPLNFPDIIPVTHVSRDPIRLTKVIEDFGGDMVVKPLRRFGGEGVIKVSNRDQENLISLLNYYTRAARTYSEREPIMVQAFLHAVKTHGDVRILLLDGAILGAMRRLPRQGDFRTNVHVGASVTAHEITDRDRFICAAITPRLQADGLHFVGIDIIGERLVEINCVSPGGIPRINRLNGVRLERQVIDFIEEKVRQRRSGPLPAAVAP
jgi:glutathione synthase